MAIDVGRVEMIDINSIIVEDRYRKNLGDLTETEENMKKVGLATPLTFKDNKDGTYKLLAGERRLTILRKNDNKLVPARIYDRDLSLAETRIIEMSENFYRKDLESYEYDNIIRDIHIAQQEIYGVKAPGPGHEGWTVENTAEMMGFDSKASVSTAIHRAEAREAYPELFEHCKTQSDASTLIKKMDEAIIKELIAEKIESSKAGTTTTTLAKSFIVGDFFKKVKEIPSAIMHMVEIDPPYAIDLQKAKKADGESIYQQDEYNEVDKHDYLAFMMRTFTECYRVMADHSWLICWFAPEPWFEDIYGLLVGAGFESTRMCGIWVKPYGQSKRPEMHLANSYEMFFYAWKGRPAINKAGRSNVFDYSPVPPQQKTHPTERPVELMKDIYETFAFPGSRILIPFLGSGSGLIAAHELGMSATGFELSKGYRDSFLVKIHSKTV